MPTPARTSLDAIVAAGRTILEAEGADGLTMRRVAAAVGIRAPSLYKRVRDRADLLRLILNAAGAELAASLDEAATTGNPRRDLVALARTFRTFARRNPETYALMFARSSEGARMDPDLTERASAALLRAAAELAGPERRLEAARTVVAWAHGFISMELAGAFRLGGDVDEAFAYGVDRLATAIEGPSGLR
jgi:AcrR family transcriptional regulator